MSSKATIKDRTLELYKSLPQDEASRKACIDIRNEIIELNYKFFGFIASKTYVGNSSTTYEDKFQSVVFHFCECWWQYLWEGDGKRGGYRTDIAFTVFFTPRLQEMVRRELNDVKYSVRRSLCLKVSKQLGKPWSTIKYEDLNDPRLKLSASDLQSLKTIFGTIYAADIASVETYIGMSAKIESKFENYSDAYNSTIDLLISEMIRVESKLSKNDLKRMSETYGIKYSKLQYLLPEAEKKLYDKLKEESDFRETWEYAKDDLSHEADIDD